MMLRQCLDKLLYFKAVYDAGSVHAAARHMHIAQPSVTYAIKFLEDALETQLFFRDRKGMRLTETGQSLKRYTEEILQCADRADQEVRQPEDPLAGILRVGTYDIFAVHLVPLVLAKFKTALPQLRIELFIDNSNSKLLGALERGDIHLAIMASPKPARGQIIRGLYTESFAFFSQEKGGRELSREQVEKKSLIAFGQAISTPGKTIFQVLERLSLETALRHNLPSFDAVLSFAQMGLGIALAPLVLTERIIKPQNLFRVRIKGVREDVFGSQKIGLVTRNHYASDPKVVAFSQSILRQVGHE